MAMRKARRERQAGRRRRGDAFEIAFEKCSGECKVQVTKILTNPIVPEIKSVNPGDNPKQKDATKAATALKDAIVKWGEPVELEPKCKTPGCKCTEIDTDDVDWNKKKTHTRKFQNPFKSNGKDFKAEIDIDFKVAIVTKACIEDPTVPIEPV
ncbi:MAG TPA: hypothetical protein VKH64_14930 [Candidatus Binatia bacterium]|nr:hypothetical protein [Candidatus Binatia bacterium]